MWEKCIGNKCSKQVSVKMPWEEHRPLNDFLESNIEKIHFKTVRI